MFYEFADCRLDLTAHRLLRGGAEVHVEPQVFDILVLLAARGGALVSKDDLVETVWRGLAISDATIAARINAARRAVGDDGKRQAVIETVARRGFRMKPRAVPGDVEAPGVEERPEAAHVRVVAPAAEIRFARATDGAALAWSAGGEGPPLLRAGHWLSHLDLDRQSSVWAPLLARLSARHRLICYDQRGTGLSDREAGFGPVGLFADDLGTVADAAGASRFAIFAASQAVPVAIDYAARHPGRVTGMVLYGGFAQGRALRPARPGEMDEALALSLIRAGWGRPESPFAEGFSRIYMPDATPAQLAEFTAIQFASVGPEGAVRLRQAVDRFDVVARLGGGHRVPALVVHAVDDAVQPLSEGRRIAAGLAGARFLPVEGRNHVLVPQTPAWARMMDEADGFLSALSGGAP